MHAPFEYFQNTLPYFATAVSFTRKIINNNLQFGDIVGTAID